jgi:hypothetical protein
MSEDALQQLCYIWFHNRYPNLRGLLFHVPNGGSRNVLEAMKMRKIGVVPGVADLLLLYNGKCYCLELKTATGTQSKKQKAWQKTVMEQSLDYFIIRDLSSFQSTIMNIIQ